MCELTASGAERAQFSQETGIRRRFLSDPYGIETSTMRGRVGATARAVAGKNRPHAIGNGGPITADKCRVDRFLREDGPLR